MEEILLFDKWGTEGIEVSDLGLKRYINLQPKLVPKTGGRHAGRNFYKSKLFIVERLINKMQVVGHKGKNHKKSSGHNTGKIANIHAIVKEAFEIIEAKTSENPIKVFVKALENACVREEIISIEYGGARYPKPVESSPQRRIDIALRYMTQGAYDACFNKRKSAAQALAAEILAAFEISKNSFAVSRKFETERQCDSAR